MAEGAAFSVKRLSARGIPVGLLGVSETLQHGLPVVLFRSIENPSRSLAHVLAWMGEESGSKLRRDQCGGRGVLKGL